MSHATGERCPACWPYSTKKTDARPRLRTPVKIGQGAADMSQSNRRSRRSIRDRGKVPHRLRAIQQEATFLHAYRKALGIPFNQETLQAIRRRRGGRS